MPTFFETLTDLLAADTPLVTVTVVDTMGSVPQDRGSKMIVTAEGLRYGTVGGGRVEAKKRLAERRLGWQEAWQRAINAGKTRAWVVSLSV